MKIKSFALLLSLITISAISQNNDNYKAALYTYNHDLQGGGAFLPGALLNDYVKGEIHLFPSWNGQFTVITKKGESRQLFNLNYNLQTKSLESFISKDSVFQYNIEQFDYVIASNKKYKVLNDSQFNGLVQEIYNGQKVNLFNEIRLEVEQGVLNPMTQTMISEDKYVKVFNYYLFINNKYTKIKLSKSDILKQLIDKKDALKEFASKNDLSFSKEDDVNKILKYYDSL
jgi:hypothetical protein